MICTRVHNEDPPSLSGNDIGFGPVFFVCSLVQMIDNLGCVRSYRVIAQSFV